MVEKRLGGQAVSPPDFGSQGADSNPTGGEIFPEPKWCFIAQSLSSSPFYRREMTEILVKGHKTLTHPSIKDGGHCAVYVPKSLEVLFSNHFTCISHCCLFRSVKNEILFVTVQKFSHFCPTGLIGFAQNV